MVDKPNLTRIQLGRLLRQYRLRATKKPGDEEVKRVARPSKLNDLENGKVPNVKYADVLALGTTYGVSREELNNLIDLQEASSQPGWYQSFDVLDDFALFLEQESVATKIRIFETEVISGLFQTEDYLKALRGAFAGRGGEDRGVKMKRQDSMFGRKPMPNIEYLASEAALKRQVGNRGIMKEQLQRLAELDGRREVSVSMLPFKAGGHPSMNGAYVVMYFDGGEFPTTVYLESLDGSRYEEKGTIVSLYEDAFARTLTLAIPIQEYLK